MLKGIISESGFVFLNFSCAVFPAFGTTQSVFSGVCGGSIGSIWQGLWSESIETLACYIECTAFYTIEWDRRHTEGECPSKICIDTCMRMTQDCGHNAWITLFPCLLVCTHSRFYIWLNSKIQYA